ncbi:hypothetical protein NBRC111894_3013 [Sporolactobacillus inulinus]|uniref:Uncharacterized protein n=1 Tax=Sporolactobacillus inulinus TaxID=2078 RepID=A0A4Y1ZEM9_9BACL|nr:hypothetical protein [Sporolactobacillus inulinus]GAY77459.1 hypothetical protein NBRC111894_3013 [Sporolactobacillus inulinus]
MLAGAFANAQTFPGVTALNLLLFILLIVLQKNTIRTIWQLWQQSRLSKED